MQCSSTLKTKQQNHIIFKLRKLRQTSYQVQENCILRIQSQPISLNHQSASLLSLIALSYRDTHKFSQSLLSVTNFSLEIAFP